MANFLVTSPNVLTEGTTSNDLIVLQSGGVIGATVYANDGNDTISAIDGGAGLNVILNGQAGADTIAFSGTQFTLGKVAGGQDNDSLTLTDLGNTTFSTIHGGKGADTITISGGSATTTTINGNAGHDLIAINAFSGTTTQLSLGNGRDTVTLSAVAFGGSLIGGGGNDLIQATSGASFKVATRIEGDSLANPELIGFDTITLSGTYASGMVVQGGFGADVMTLAGAQLSGSTVNGNEGKDSITISGDIGNGILLGGGKGTDTITVLGAFTGTFGTVFGGEGNDVIGVDAASGANGGTVFGGAGADTISFGNVTGGTTIQSRYTSFSDSNIAGYDVISATFSGTTSGTFAIGQTVVSASIGAGISVAAGTNSAFATNTVGVATTFGSDIGGGLTARAAIVDQFTVQGQAVAFTTTGGDKFVFIQGGAAGSGLDNDLIVQVDASGFGDAGLVAGSNSGITVNIV